MAIKLPKQSPQVELIVVGTGTCVSGLGWEKVDRWPPGYLITGISPNLILIEASEGIRYRINQAGEEYTNLSDIIISHLHPDHFILVPLIQSIVIKNYWSGGKFSRDKINIYGPVGVKEAFWQMWKYNVPEHPTYIYDPNGINLNFVELQNNQTVSFYQTILQAFDVFHAYGRAKSLSFRLETDRGILCYSGDSSPSDNLIKAASNANVFLCEASADVGIDKSNDSGHLNPYQAGQVATKAQVKRLLITHYSGKDSPSKIIADCRKSGYKEEITVLRDFDHLKLF